jgi:hypothetical protein
MLTSRVQWDQHNRSTRDRLKSFRVEQRGGRRRGESIDESFGSGTILGSAATLAANTV